MKTFRELYGSCWNAWRVPHREFSRRNSQWRIMGDFMWAAFCVQWVAIAWCAVVGKDSTEFFTEDEVKESDLPKTEAA